MALHRRAPKVVVHRDRAIDNQGAQFVSLGMGALGGGTKTVMDMISRQGDRMRIETPAGSVDVLRLCEGFWSAAP
jgi:hypothetical protein